MYSHKIDCSLLVHAYSNLVVFYLLNKILSGHSFMNCSVISPIAANKCQIIKSN